MDLTNVLNNTAQELDDISQKILLLEGNIFDYISESTNNSQLGDLHEFDDIVQKIEELTAFIRRIGPLVGPTLTIDIGPAIKAVRLEELRNRIINSTSSKITLIDKPGSVDLF